MRMPTFTLTLTDGQEWTLRDALIVAQRTCKADADFVREDDAPLADVFDRNARRYALLLRDIDRQTGLTATPLEA